MNLNFNRVDNRLLAAKWSLIPGGGQVYNKQLWKTPIIYGLLGTTAFLYVRNEKDYLSIIESINIACPMGLGQGQCIIDPNNSNPSSLFSSLQIKKERFDRNRRALQISGIGFFSLQIIDAYLSANRRAKGKIRSSKKVSPLMNLNLVGGTSYGLLIDF